MTCLIFPEDLIKLLKNFLISVFFCKILCKFAALNYVARPMDVCSKRMELNKENK